ncbi:hypothetical protein [Lentzea jiangxiensis]|uniref:Uncharacterized protein n=1 Tax=Lentzea jiangxiensis TaxID=641025 RepID=A0A1H0DJX9_9PSEU|nr:hypothetical protein [Lentzea jiangxiensis]SDN70434.1 hypothetical protein SAMN05421507_10113 [Lentzea jiangxiensis]
MSLELSKETSRGDLWLGGTVTYRVTLDGVWVGWVGDGRRWRGWGYGGRRWWACWRQDGDTAARWSSELEHGTRIEALNALRNRIGTQHRA